MREGLRKLEGQRLRFVGTFDRFGIRDRRTGCRSKTILLRSVHEAENGTLVTDHLWLRCVKSLELLDLRFGDKIAFDARVLTYVRENGSCDYRLANPSKIERISRLESLDGASFM